MNGELKERKEKIISYFKEKQNWIIYGILAIITYIGFKLRTSNMHLLKDVVTGKYVPLALDPHVFLRYVKHELEHGSMMAIDFMRNYPLGFNMEAETPLLPHFIVYLYKVMHFFNSSITIEQAHVLYPVVCFSIALIFFFLLVKNLFDSRVALLSSAILAVIPSFLYRTMAGFSDKEALGTMLMFMTMYFFVKAMKQRKIKKNLIFGGLAGLTLSGMGLVWGGVSFLFMILGLFGILKILMDQYMKKDFYVYSSMLMVAIPILLIPGRYNLNSLFTSTTSSILLVAGFMGLLNFLLIKLDILKIRDKIRKKAPPGITVGFFSILIIVIAASIMSNYDFIITKTSSMIQTLLYASSDRWALTVAESHQPYIQDWIGQMGWKYIRLFITGSVLLFYSIIKSIDRHKWKLTGLYAIFITAFIFSRYSKTSTILNGETAISNFLFAGSPAIFFGFIIIGYVYSFYKKKEVFKKITEIRDFDHMFVLVWFVIMIMGAVRAIRLLYIFAPITAVLAGYAAFWFVDYAKRYKEDWKKIAIWGVVFLVVASPFSLATGMFGIADKGILVKFTELSRDTAKYTGPSYNQQWQIGMEWVRENTPEDAVFAHWWDYGYWVQTGGERATITDGGNARGDWNHFMGRHVLTGQSDTEALEFLYAHNATHLLMISDEIGKYPAYSSIGADADYDRYSWINVFKLDINNIQEKRDETVFLYQGGTLLDEDFVYEGQLYPNQGSGIGGFFLPMKQDNDTLQFEQPIAALMYNGQQKNVPVECLYFDGQEYHFDQEGLKGCLRIIPTIEGNEANKMGAMLYMSEKVVKGRFGQMYLLEKESPYFEIVYDDEANIPLSIYNGRIIGPMKIWKISYPEDIEFNEGYITGSIIDPRVYEI